ncbi:MULTISPECIES: hypothetical protein [unclassified Neptuniibacter]|uniref:hypothetical protein n=1 Tax=unclassified Neptuniibacter TaxID=2630693 RepID=UPI0025FA7ACA|nr:MULTISPECIES: hypothetical protein [unclassified Neptuniibacter]|tara:strand:+ start:31240 stop:31443 length:204 start_codon:yes stop_codon:yes gene_type:complete
MQNLQQISETRWKFTGKYTQGLITYGRFGLTWCYEATNSNNKHHLAGNLNSAKARLIKSDKPQEPTQ